MKKIFLDTNICIDFAHQRLLGFYNDYNTTE